MLRDKYRQGISISELARLSGHDRKTIRRMVKPDEPLTLAAVARHAKARKLDAFVDYLQARIAKGVLNARKLYGEISAQGCTGKETQVRSFVQPFRQARQAQATVRLHGTTGEVPFARLPLEELQPVGAKPTYDISLSTYRRSSSDCLVSYEGNYYSVPALYAKQRLLVKETEQSELIVLTPQGDEIARHRLATGHNQRIVVAAHYQGLPTNGRLAQRPSAIQILVKEGRTLPAFLAAPTVEARPLHF